MILLVDKFLILKSDIFDISSYYEKVKRLTLSVIFFYCYLLNSASKGRGLPSVNIFTVLR